MKHVVLAFKDFLARYRQVFAAAWSERATLDAPSRTADELAFLPAHLELTDTPVSPTARWTIRLIIGLFTVALLWAIVGKLDIVAVATGKTVAGSRTKVIQPIETAIVRRILVQDGQFVRKGQLLIELDTTTTAADYEKADEALINARLDGTRLAALATALQDGHAPNIAVDAELPALRQHHAQELASSQYAAYRARYENLAAAIVQHQAELQTVQSSIGPLQETEKIARSREDDYAKLLERRYVGRHDYLLRVQERIAVQRDLAAQQSRLVELRAAILGAREEQHVLVTGTRQQTLDELRQARDQISQYAPEVAKARQHDRLMRLRAPVDGTVQQLAVHTVGGVVTPAQSLLAVVPSEDALEVEATVLNKDIGFVEPGQRATVKVESFPYTRYGYLEGTVTSVSRDAAQDEKLGLVFPARIRLRRSDLAIDGKRVRLSPGMTLSVEIKTGGRRVIDYLLSPLRTRADESLRER